MKYEVTIIQHRSVDGCCGYDESVLIEFFTLREATVFAEMVIENSNNTKVTIAKKQKEEEANGMAVSA